jgi:hypothetical protein
MALRRQDLPPSKSLQMSSTPSLIWDIGFSISRISRRAAQLEILMVNLDQARHGDRTVTMLVSGQGQERRPRISQSHAVKKPTFAADPQFVGLLERTHTGE